MNTPNGSLPLSSYFVLDLTRARAGPTAVRQLADWGANVIKVEELVKPGDEDNSWDLRHGPDFQNLHRNKRSLTLNLKDPAGLAIFKRLADKADVVVENYRPDVKHRLGIDYETLKRPTRASCMPASRASARTARTRIARASIRWCKALAG